MKMEGKILTPILIKTIFKIVMKLDYIIDHCQA